MRSKKSGAKGSPSSMSAMGKRYSTLDVHAIRPER